MSNEIVQSIVDDNYDDFQHVNFKFSQNLISIFWGLFNDETDLRVRYTYLIPVKYKYQDPDLYGKFPKMSNTIPIFKSTLQWFGS